MSINNGFYSNMPITSSMDLKNERNDSNNNTANIIQSFLLHLLFCSFIALGFVLYEFWNEIFGGTFFGFLDRYSFLRICNVSLYFCLPISLLFLRGLLMFNSNSSNSSSSSNKDTANSNSQNIGLTPIYIFNIFQSLALISLTGYVESDTILIGIISTIFNILQLLILYSCCNSSGYKYRKDRISRIISVLIISILFVSLTCYYTWKLKKLKMTLLIFVCTGWYYFRLIYTIEKLMHFRNDHVKYPMITPSLFLITFLLDVYFVLIIEYINFKFLSSCLSCCGMKEKRKRNTFRCCRNGTHYYPFTINYVDDIENDYKQEEDDNEKEEEEDHVSNDIENEITSLLESSKKNNENINVVIVEEKDESSDDEEDNFDNSQDNDTKEQYQSDSSNSSSLSENDEQNNQIDESLESLKNSLEIDNPDDDDFSSDSSENEETFDKVEDDDIANNGKDVDYVIDKEVDGILSDKIQDTRKVNRRLDAFLLLHDEHTTSNYESLLHGLFINCCSNGEKKHEFSSATWKSFNIDLKKYDKSYKMKAKEFVKKKKKTKEKKNASVEISYPNIEAVDILYREMNVPSSTILNKDLYEFQVFKHLWKTLSEKMFFTATVHDAEVKFTEEFGIPMTKVLAKRHKMQETREKSISRVLKSEAVSTIFRNNRRTLKFLFIYYAPLVTRKDNNRNGKSKNSQQRVLTQEKYFQFIDDFALSKASVPIHLKLSVLRIIFNQVIQNIDSANGGCTFGLFRAVLLRIAIEISNPLKTKNSGAIKAGEAARALTILLNELERRVNSSGNKFLIKKIKG